VIPSAWLIFKGDNSWELWLALCFFGLGYIVSLFNILDRRVQIIINKNGIWDRTTKMGIMEWELIKAAYEVQFYKQRFISLTVDEKLKSRKKVYAWASYLNKTVGAQDINLSITEIKVNIEKLLTLINILKSEPIERRDEVIAMYKDRL
jgi:hypothetical protein